MNPDIAKYVEQIVEKLTGDNRLMEKFQADPVSTVTGLLGVKLDGDLLDGVIAAVRGKLDLEGLKDKAGDLLGSLKGLFDK